MFKRMLSETEINNLSDEEFADYLGNLAETNQHGARIAGGSPNFEITQATQGNDVDPTNEWQELTSGGMKKVESMSSSHE